MLLGDFFSLHIQNQKESPKTSISEPMVLSMLFPTRVVLVTINSPTIQAIVMIMICLFEHFGTNFQTLNSEIVLNTFPIMPHHKMRCYGNYRICDKRRENMLAKGSAVAQW